MLKTITIIPLITITSCINATNKDDTNDYILEEDKSKIDYENKCNPNFAFSLDQIEKPNIISNSKKVYFNKIDQAIERETIIDEINIWNIYESRSQSFVPSDETVVHMTIKLIFGFYENRIPTSNLLDPKLDRFGDIRLCSSPVFIGIEWPWRDHIDMYECDKQGADEVYRINDGFFQCSLKREDFGLYLKLPKRSERSNFSDQALYDFIEQQGSKESSIQKDVYDCITEQMERNVIRDEAERHCKSNILSKFKVHFYVPSMNQHFIIERQYNPSPPFTYNPREDNISNRSHGYLK